MLSKDLANAGTTRVPNHFCGVSLMLTDIERKQGTAEASKVQLIVEDTTRVATTLSKILRDNGYAITDQTIRRHRKKQCSCR